MDLKEHIQGLPYNHLIDNDSLSEIFEDRWVKMDFDCMGYAHVLCPIKLVADRIEKEE